jgi:NADH-quinone oxidoreductase subunit A
MIFSWMHLAIMIFFLAGVIFATAPILASLLIAPKAKSPALFQPYECGMSPHGSAWVKFGINYYFYALLFLAFDVDVLYLFPVAVFYPESAGFMPFFEILIFVLILFAAIIYFWKKGVFTWPRRIKV